MEIAIIADDLTGASDTGVQLVRSGYRTAVIFSGYGLSDLSGVDAVAMDTDSRSLPPEKAYERVLDTGRALGESGIIYKKLDSTLRGPVAAELAAALEATGRERVILAPAFPAAGRTTRNGVQLLHGRPLHETELAKAPLDPVREGNILALLSGAGLGGVAVLETRDLPDEERCRRVIVESGCVVADAETEGHLESLVRSVPDPSRILWAGSAGLAQALGRVYPGPASGDAAVAFGAANRVLTAAGSASEVTRGQCDRLAREPGVEPVSLGGFGGAVEEAAATARAALSDGNHVILYPDRTETSGTGVDARRIVGALAEIAADLSERGLFEALVLTGGETAVNVARRLGARGILLERELEAGVPAGSLIGPRPYPVVTKAGAFGSPETLLDVLHVLTAPLTTERSSR